MCGKGNYPRFAIKQKPFMITYRAFYCAAKEIILAALQ
jgi:hypothetical protein